MEDRQRTLWCFAGISFLSLKFCICLLIFNRYLKMPCSFFLEELQTSQWSFLQWTTLTRSSPLHPTAASNLPLPSELLLPLARRLWTDTTIRLIILKSIGFLWVFFCFTHYQPYWICSSPPSVPQAQILQKAEVGSAVDSRRPQHCSLWIWLLLCTSGHSGSEGWWANS